MRVGVFDENDRNAILGTISGFTLKSGAKSEMENWSAGYPPFYLVMLNHIIKSGATGEIDNQTVNEVAVTVRDEVNIILSYLWNDCTEPAKDIYRYLMKQGEIATATMGNYERICLEEKGFIRTSGNKETKGCRLEQYIKSLGGDIGSIMRLFGTWEEYKGNIRSLLELRLSHLTSLDGTLRRFLQRSIEDIPDNPEVCLSSMRGVVDKVLDLIWDSELGPDRIIPLEWFTKWQHNSERGAESYWESKFPTRRGHQIRLLQLLTGTQNSPPKARRVSKGTWALVNAAHGFGDFGQHIDGVEIHAGVAISAVNICLELAACLERELCKV